MSLISTPTEEDWILPNLCKNNLSLGTTKDLSLCWGHHVKKIRVKPLEQKKNTINIKKKCA